MSNPLEQLLKLSLMTLGLLLLNVATIHTKYHRQDKYKQKNASQHIQKEFRGVWIASVANLHWPSKRGLSTEEQQNELCAMLDKIAALNLNVIILQIRPACDALYHSTLEPWSEVLTGTMGKAPDPYYDPLEFAIKEAHKRNLELHAWINPFRARVNYKTAKSPADPLHVSQKFPDFMIPYSKNLLLNPGEPKALKHVLEVVKDIVMRYEIDGFHIDDYFYPYPEKDKNFDDLKSYTQYGGILSLKEWRRNNINTFVQTMYKMIKKLKPQVKVSISPFGIWQPGVPEGINGGISAYDDLCADSKKWLNEGWCDYFMPQLYWAISSKQDYKSLLDWWVTQNKHHKLLVPGNYLFLKPQEIINQINITRNTRGTAGNCLYSIEPLLNKKNNIYDLLLENCYSTKTIA